MGCATNQFDEDEEMDIINGLAYPMPPLEGLYLDGFDAFEQVRSFPVAIDSKLSIFGMCFSLPNGH
jgi:hypothetical protein